MHYIFGYDFSAVTGCLPCKKLLLFLSLQVTQILVVVRIPLREKVMAVDSTLRRLPRPTECGSKQPIMIFKFVHNGVETFDKVAIEEEMRKW